MLVFFMSKNKTLLVAILVILSVIIIFFLRFKGGIGTNSHDGSYAKVLELAIRKKEYSICNEITVRPFYGDYYGTVAENIEICKAEYSVITNNLDLCLSINSYIRNNVCLPKIAGLRKDVHVCNNVYGEGKDDYIETRISTCVTNSEVKN